MQKTILLAFLVFAGLSSACGGRKTASQTPVKKPALNEPDKTLFERAQHEMKRGRFDIARLSLQTLVNTYPDSEYLPKAKYGMGEASYREGGKEKLDQAAAEFEDFITFFPTTDDADDAQLMIALTHYRQMLAPDRDQTQARYTLFELDKMIKDYPDSPLLEEAKARRRLVQELLAEGDFRIARQYMIQKQYLAAIARFDEIVAIYPDYSKMDEALFALGESLYHAGAKLGSENPDVPLGGCGCAIQYMRIVRDYPRSDRVEASKKRLTEMNLPVPEPNPAALSREDTKIAERSIFGRVFSTVLERGPVGANKTGATSVTVDDNKKAGNENILTVSPRITRP